MLNEALRLVRVYHDLNQGDAAQKVGLSRSYICEIESGRKKVTLDVLEKYAQAFNIPVSSLMLFAEKNEDRDFSEDIRTFIADKVVKMLDWINVISDSREIDKDAQ